MQIPEISRRQALGAAVLAFVVLVAAGKLIGGNEASGGAKPRARLVASGKPSQGAIYVDVSGAVRRPGLYKLAAGSRVNDALVKAGGATRDGDLTLINRAATLSDGEQVLVPLKPDPAALASGGQGSAAPVSGPLRLNFATVEQLDELPGIGPATAQRIIDYRLANGPFKSVDELDEVSGIGPARLAELRELVVP